MDVPDEWPSPAFGRGQNPAYRPSGTIFRKKNICGTSFRHNETRSYACHAAAAQSSHYATSLNRNLFIKLNPKKIMVLLSGPVISH